MAWRFTKGQFFNAWTCFQNSIKMSRLRIDRAIQNCEQLKRTLPTLIANQAVNYFVGTFTRAQFDGKKWKEVKRRIPDTAAYRYPKKKGLSRRTKPILIGTGNLRRAVSASKRRVTWDRIDFVVAVPYAGFQNYGTDTIPARKYIGDSKYLRNQQIKLIKQEADKIFRK